MSSWLLQTIIITLSIQTSLSMNCGELIISCNTGDAACYDGPCHQMAHYFTNINAYRQPIVITPYPTYRTTSKPTPRPTYRPIARPYRRPTRSPITKQPSIFMHPSTRLLHDIPTEEPTPLPTPNPTPRPPSHPTPSPTSIPTARATAEPTIMEIAMEEEGADGGSASSSDDEYDDDVGFVHKLALDESLMRGNSSESVYDSYLYNLDGSPSDPWLFRSGIVFLIICCCILPAVYYWYFKVYWPNKLERVRLSSYQRGRDLQRIINGVDSDDTDHDDEEFANSDDTNV